LELPYRISKYLPYKILSHYKTLPLQAIIEAFLNMIEILGSENEKLKDEVNRLKSEQGKPNIKG